jgi:hypothetical protein
MNASAANKKVSGSRTIFWWIVWIALTIGSFFIASTIWTPIIAAHFGSVRETRASIAWVTAVFGTWMIILVPLIIVMYSKVDKTYEDARIRREKKENSFRSLSVDPGQRLLPPAVASQMAGWPETIEGGHLVHLKLKDGRTIEYAFISERREILGLYNAFSFSFQAKDVTDILPVDFSETTPSFITNLWLRLDGVQVPE